MEFAFSARGHAGARVLRREVADGRPIKTVAAVSEESQELVVQQTAQRHGHAQSFGCGQRETDVLEFKRGGERGVSAGSFLGPHVGQLCIAQVELPLDPAPCVVL